MTDKQHSELQQALTQLQQWVDAPPADNVGRIPPSFLGLTLPDLRKVLDRIRAALLSSEVLTDQQRLQGLSAVVQFTLSWQSTGDENGSAITFDTSDLRTLAQTLNALTDT